MTQRGPEPWRLPRGDEVETQVPQGIDTSIAHPARMYDYFLGGKNNFAADRAAADLIIQAVPETRYVVRTARDFLIRAVRTVTEEYGMRQFLDIGTGIPAPGNVQEIAQAVAPEAHIAHVDNDPIVLAHARALLTSTPEGRITVFHGDLREPEKIVNAPEVREVVDFDRPVVLVLGLVLHFLRDSEDPAGIMARLHAALPPGSMLILTHVSFKSEELKRYAEEVYDSSSTPVVPRTADEIAAFLAGFDPVEPGLVRAPLWRPAPGTPEPTPQELEEAVIYTAVAVKA